MLSAAFLLLGTILVLHHGIWHRGRGNRTDPRVDILTRMADRSKQIVWLNPEYRTLWGTGDSDMLRYAPHCRVTAVCNTLQHLERVIGELLRVG
jgi:uncharacterized protein with von Willebrand factor type A (vWA) domain